MAPPYLRNEKRRRGGEAATAPTTRSSTSVADDVIHGCTASSRAETALTRSSSNASRGRRDVMVWSRCATIGSVTVGERVEARGNAHEMRAPPVVFAFGRQLDQVVGGRRDPRIDGAHTPRDRGVVQQCAVEQQLRAHVGAGPGGTVGQVVVAEEFAQLALEVEEPLVRVERVVGGVVEGDPAAERTRRCAEAGAAHRGEVG